MRFLPGPLTVLLPRKKNLEPGFWNQFPDIGFRYPDHPVSLELIKFVGTPLITTSANVSGEPPPCQVKELPDQLLKQIPLILDGGLTEKGQPSSIIRIKTKNKRMELIRAGCIPSSELENAFNECISLN
jgi:L-threonylcarbamoyladenylate synthase